MSPRLDHIPLWQMLQEEYAGLHGPLPQEYWDKQNEARARHKNAAASIANTLDEELLSLVHQYIHERSQATAPRGALCLSGGGIRSATFALGAVQTLADKGLLGQFDYVSTVSGGGYTGSFLSAWIHNHPGGADGVFAELKSANHPSDLRPEPSPIRHLRTYSNYLSPRLGLLSADTWTLVATFLRNLILNWLVLLPFLFAVLLLPRIYFRWVKSLLEEGWDRSFAWILLALGAVFHMLAVAYMDRKHPSTDRDGGGRKNDQRSFLLYCLAPLVVASALLTLGWAALVRGRDEDSFTYGVLPALLGASLVLAFLAWAFNLVISPKSAADRSRWQQLPFILAASLVAGWLTWLGSLLLATAGYSPISYTAFAAPAYLMSVVGAGVLLRGLLSRTNTDEDREWSSRASGWLLIVALAWVAVAVLVLYAPLLLLTAGLKVRAAVLSAGGIAGVVAALLAQNRGTPARSNAVRTSPTGDRVRELALRVLAPAFVVLMIPAASLATDWLVLRNSWRYLGVPSKLPAWVERSSGTEASTRPAAATTGTGAEGVTAASLTGKVFHRAALEGAGSKQLLLLLALLMLLCAGMSLCVNINKFSLHGVYRSRLTRAYLGASRAHRAKSRTFNPFIGFDPEDNVPMYQLMDYHHCLAAVLTSEDPPANPLRDELRPYFKNSIATLSEWNPTVPLTSEARAAIVTELAALWNANAGRLKSDDTDDSGWTWEERIACRWSILRERLLATMAGAGPRRPVRPLHVLNVALNLVGGDNLAWQERRAESFTVSSLHVGTRRLGYRDAAAYGGALRGVPPWTKWEPHRAISLATAMTISGAAANPNMGYHSSTVITQLMTLFNVRLGAWLGNPGKEHEGEAQAFGRGSPNASVRPLLEEAFGHTNDRSEFVNLSDGGHFDNLGLYEMVGRRCRYIVVFDGGRDPECAFDDLGNALRKINIDMGVRITFDAVRIRKRDLASSSSEGRYCAVGTIHYSEVDRLPDGAAAPNGQILYIKPAFYGDEPIDVFNYAKTCTDFPHESTADQFFGESQLESYRALGAHAMTRITRGLEGKTLKELIAAADAYARSDPQAEGLTSRARPKDDANVLRRRGAEPRA